MSANEAIATPRSGPVEPPDLGPWPLSPHEAYACVETAADGPAPGKYSMLSAAVVVVDAGGALLGEGHWNLAKLDGARAHPDAMARWHALPHAWGAARQNPIDPCEAMQALAGRVRAAAGARHPVFVAAPASRHFMWTQWYLHAFAPRAGELFGDAVLDIHTLINALAGGGARASARQSLSDAFAPAATGLALDDARRVAHALATCTGELRDNRRFTEHAQMLTAML